MADPYKLYYWPGCQFRCEFAKALFAYTNTKYTLEGSTELQLATADLKRFYMGLPVMFDKELDQYINQLPAIMLHLATKFKLMPESLPKKTMAMKTVCDCPDILEALTRNSGSAMWDDASWNAFIALDGRLIKWIQILENTAVKQGLETTSGFIVGTDEPCVADISVYALVSTLNACLPKLMPFFNTHAPRVMALMQRLKQQHAGLRAYSEGQPAEPFCLGQIETSIRAQIAKMPNPVE